jgi:hypothetical protein
MQRRLVLAVAFAAAGCGAGSDGNRIYDFGPGGGDLAGADLAGADLTGFPPSDMSLYGGPCDPQHPCPMGNMCFQGQCLPDNGTCSDDSQCENDTYCDCTGGGGGDAGACMGGVCIPYGVPPRGSFNPDCHGESFSASDFKPPIVKCSWTQGDVIDTPVVVDLDLDGKPEIVFLTGPYSFADPATLVAIRGDTCQVVFQKSTNLDEWSQIAAADLDGDKFPEIVGVDYQQHLLVFDHTGNLVATSSGTYQGAGGGSDCTGPAIVDVDGVAPPEIAVGGMVARYVKGQGFTTLFSKAATPASWGTMSATADLDGDGVPELITGREVYDAKTGAVKTPAGWGQLSGPGAYVAVADLNKDGKPDVVLIQSSAGAETASVWDWANQRFIFGPFAVPNGWGGPPTVADFDGDGTPDFASAGPANYFVFAMKCWPNGGNGCASKGILWQKATHDASSGGTGSSVFDFNGDGKAEVVYRDECFFRVMDGTSGKTVFAQQITSGTCLENPVIADVDNDGHADVVVPSDNVQASFDECAGTGDADTGLTFTGYTNNGHGIYVLQDPMNRWMPSRAIWNQHTYHITNVNDDATVPTSEMPNWAKWNNYRQNVQGAVGGMNVPQTDYTGASSSMVDSGSMCAQMETLYAQICNRGTADAPAPVSGTFYTSDPRQNGATKICTTKTTMTLMPGTCETVSCVWMSPPAQPTNVWFRADDDGTVANVSPECDNGNDLLLIKGVSCQIPG